jgi:hypothetical protein
MSYFSNFASTDLPVGDKSRVAVTTVTYGTEATILNVASGGAIVRSIIVEGVRPLGVAGGVFYNTLTNLKVTADGATERTLTYGTRLSNCFFTTNATAVSPAVDIGYEISVANSLIIKINLAATNLLDTTVNVTVNYLVK